MVQGIADQILDQTPSSTQAKVNAEESNQTVEPNSNNQGMSDFDSRFSVLTKMERKIKEQEALHKNKSKEWEDKDKKLMELEEFMKLMDENPLEALKKRKGWGVQEFNEFAVQHSSDEDLDPVARIEKGWQAKFEALKEEMNKGFEEKLRAKEEEINAKDYERQIVEFKSGIKSFLSENKDAYEFIHAEEGGSDAVYDLIYQDLNRQKKAAEEGGIENPQFKLMDLKEAADKVENFLDSQYSKYLSLNKVKSKFPKSNEADISRFVAESAPSTMNSSFSPKSKSTGELSEEGRKQAAIDFLKSQKLTS